MRLRRLAEQVIDAGAPGVLVQVRDRGKTRTIVLGVAHDAPRRLIRSGDRFRIGSVTKTFVATVVLQLVAEGRIGLEDTVDEWLPGLVPNGEADHHPAATRSPVRPLRLRRGRERLRAVRAGPPARVEPACARRAGRRASVALPSRRALRVLEHELPASRAHRRASVRHVARASARRAHHRAARVWKERASSPASFPAHTSTDTVRRRTRGSSQARRATRVARRPPGPGARRRSSRLRTISAGSFTRCSAAGCWLRLSSGTWRRSCRRDRCATASASPSSRLRVATPGATRATPRARSPSPGTPGTPPAR